MAWKDKLKGGLADQLTPKAFPKKLLREGMQHELEHTSNKKIAAEIAMDHLAEDINYYKKLKRIENPSTSRRQQRFMCAEYGRKKRGQRTRTGMSKQQLREFCMARKTRRKKNPHLRSGKWQFLGMFASRDIGQVKRMLKIHGMKYKVTKDHLKGEKGMRELYIEKGRFDIAYRTIARLFTSKAA